MLVAADGLHPHANVLGHLGELRNHGEHADGAGEAGGIGINLLAAAGNPVTAGSGIVSVGGHEGLNGHELVQSSSDFDRGGYTTAGRVHAKDDGFHLVVIFHLLNDPHKTVSRHFKGLVSLYNFSFGIDNGHLVPGEVLTHLGLDVICKGNQVNLLNVLNLSECANLVLQGFVVYQFVHQAVLHKVLRKHKGEVVYEAVELLYRDTPCFGHRSCHGSPEGVHHHLRLLPVLGGRGAADEHLSGTFIFAMTDELHVHSQLVQDVLEEELLGGQAR